MIVENKVVTVKPYTHNNKVDTAGCTYIFFHTYTHIYVTMMIKEKAINLRVERDMEGFKRGYEGRRENKENDVLLF